MVFIKYKIGNLIPNTGNNNNIPFALVVEFTFAVYSTVNYILYKLIKKFIYLYELRLRFTYTLVSLE